MATVELEQKRIIESYNQANDDQKKLLESLFGKEMFEFDYKSIKTYKDACKREGVTPIDENSDLPKDVIAFLKLRTIAKALRNGWKPKWEDTNEYKYYPWFDIVPAGVGFAFNGSDLGVSDLNSSYVASLAAANFGGALASESSKIARYFGETFAEIWAEYLLPNNI